MMNHAYPVRRVLALLIAAVAIGSPASPAAAQSPPRDECAACHAKLDDVKLAAPVQAYKDDIHATRGFTCAECHGGDPRAGVEAGAHGKGFIGKPTGRQVLQVCGRCHSDAAFMKRFNPALRVDQEAEYATSVHGQRLLGKGDSKVATCVSCHSAHQIRPPGDTRSTVNAINVARTCGACHADSAYMKQYGIPTDQLENYKKSIHWKALSVGGDRSAPTCNDCHGNHGAAPPGVNSVANVCGQCHSVMADYFAASKHGEIFVKAELPGCATCHSNHDVIVPTDTALGFAEGTICGKCHSEGDEGALSAVAMRAAIDSLKGGIHIADSLLTSAEQAGMEVSQPQFDLRNANSTLLQARASVHTFVADSVRLHIKEGMTIAKAAIVRGRRALEDLRFRRVGLGVSSLIILVLVAGLLLKIRQLEAPARQAGTSGPSATGGHS